MQGVLQIQSLFMHTGPELVRQDIERGIEASQPYLTTRKSRCVSARAICTRGDQLHPLSNSPS